MNKYRSVVRWIKDRIDYINGEQDADSLTVILSTNQNKKI